ncbi:MAG: hypothetical protein ACYDBV_01130, partial [Nitrospiria bacterium]
MDLPSKVILILASEPGFVRVLKSRLETGASTFYIAKSVHGAVIQAILAEPDIVLIEVSPKNFSGLQLPGILSQIKGLKAPPAFLFIADKRRREHIKQAGDSIYYVDEQELPLLIHDVIHNRERVTGHGFSSELEEEETSTHVKN